MRCIEGGFQCSICFLDANPNDWRKCWSKLIFRIIVQQHFWRKFSFHGVPEKWGSNARVPSVTGGWGGGGGKGFDIFRNCTMRYWRQCSGAPLLRLSPAPTRFSRNFSRSAFFTILKVGICYKGNKRISSHDCTDLKLNKNLPKKGWTGLFSLGFQSTHH